MWLQSAKVKQLIIMCSLCTCMSIVCDGLDGVRRGEVDEGKVMQVRVSHNMAGGYINRGLPFFSTESTGDVSPVARAVSCERKRCRNYCRPTMV